MFIFGLGYSASRIAGQLAGWQVSATGGAGTLAFEDHAAVRRALAAASHVLSSVPPLPQGGDPVLDLYGDALAGKSLSYLSSTGVYGDCGGAWVDETAPVGGGRRGARALADAAWLARGARVFRLPGIYGPGRSALDRVRTGTAHRIADTSQVFSRVHVEDIAAGVLAGLDAPAGAYNLADDLPCHPNAVIEEACRLLRLPPPKLQSLDDLSGPARGFYRESRRIANGKARRVLGWRPAFPSHREGLAALAQSCYTSEV